MLCCVDCCWVLTCVCVTLLCLIWPSLLLLVCEFVLDVGLVVFLLNCLGWLVSLVAFVWWFVFAYVLVLLGVAAFCFSFVGTFVFLVLFLVWFSLFGLYCLLLICFTVDY